MAWERLGSIYVGTRVAGASAWPPCSSGAGAAGPGVGPREMRFFFGQPQTAALEVGEAVKKKIRNNKNCGCHGNRLPPAPGWHRSLEKAPAAPSLARNAAPASAGQAAPLERTFQRVWKTGPASCGARGGGGIGVARGAGSLASPGRTRCLGVRPGVPSKEVSALGPLPTWGHSPPWSGRVQPGEEREQ